MHWDGEVSTQWCCARTLQFLVAPHIGALSDKYGRKKVLLATMVGNILSALVYVLAIFLATRPS